MSTPRFLQRLQKRSPGAASAGSPRPHNRGASMTQSKSPGGIGFLSKQYQAVVQQSPGAPPPPPSPAAATTTAAVTAAAAAPLPPPPLVELAPMPTDGAGASDIISISNFLKTHRDVVGKRRSDGANSQWCTDYERLLFEAQNVVALLTFTEKAKVLSDQRVAELEGTSKQRADEVNKEEDDMIVEIGRLKGTVSKLEAEVRSKTTLLEDECARSEALREERNEARMSELMAINNEATKAECEKLAASVAKLETDNAILLAEKSQWLNQLESENSQLQELFDDARGAKDVMVRELNAIDEERTSLAEEREELRLLISEKKNVANSSSNSSSSDNQSSSSFSSSPPPPSVAENLTPSTFTTMGQASIKFYKLRKMLERRQEKMETVFDAGSALIEHYRTVNDDDSADALLSTLMERSLHCDMAVVEDGIARNVELLDGKDYAESDPDVNDVWLLLDERIRAQTLTMENGCEDMTEMFIEAFNAGKTGNTSNAHVQNLKINEIFKNLMSTSLQAGGSPANAGEDVEREETIFDRVVNPMLMEGSSGGGGGDGGQSSSSSSNNNSSQEVFAMENELKTTKNQLDILSSKHELLQRNHKMLADRARKAGV